MRALCFFACIMAVACMSTASAAEANRGTVVAINGEVTATPPGAVSGTLLRVGDTVAEGTVIETRADATAKIVFDKAVLSVAGGTKIELAKYYFSDEKGILESLIRLTKGLIRSQVEPGFGPGSSFQIATWNTIAGVKGTDFSVEADKDRDFSACYVFEGSIEVKNMAGRARLLSAGEMARVEGPDGAIKAGPLPQGIKGEKQITVKEAPRSAALSGGARAKALAGTSDAAKPDTFGGPPSGAEGNPQVAAVNQLINPKGLSVPPVPGQVAPPGPQPPGPQPPAPPKPPGPSVPPEKYPLPF